MRDAPKMESGLIRIYERVEEDGDDNGFVAAIRFEQQGGINELGRRLAQFLTIPNTVVASRLATSIVSCSSLTSPIPFLVRERSKANYEYEIVVSGEEVEVLVYARNCKKGVWQKYADFMFSGPLDGFVEWVKGY